MEHDAERNSDLIPLSALQSRPAGARGLKLREPKPQRRGRSRAPRRRVD